MIVENVLEWIADWNEEALLADGFEDAILGMCERFGNNPVVAYNYLKCIDILIQRDGMTHEEAEEYFSFNVLGAWMGNGTPVFVTLYVP